MPHKQNVDWKRKKAEAEARIQQLLALRDKQREWLHAAEEQRSRLWCKQSLHELAEKQNRLQKSLQETAVKLDQAQTVLRTAGHVLQQRSLQHKEWREKLLPMAVVALFIFLIGLGALLIEPSITGSAVGVFPGEEGAAALENETAQSLEKSEISLPELVPEVPRIPSDADRYSYPAPPSVKAKKNKTLDEKMAEVNLTGLEKHRVKDVVRDGFSSEEIVFNDKAEKTLRVHKPIIDGKSLPEAIPLVEKDAFTYSATFEDTTIEIEFDVQEIKEKKEERQFKQSAKGTDYNWKIQYEYLLPSPENTTTWARISSSSPLEVANPAIAELHSGPFIIDFAAELQNGYELTVQQTDGHVVYIALEKNYTALGISANEKVVIDPTLTISGTTTELCGTVTEYDTIDINTGGVLTICTQNTTDGTGKVNITLGYFGNFSLDPSSRIEGKGLGATGGLGVTGGGSGAISRQGNNGDNATNGSIAVTPNGGGGGGGQKVGNNDAAAGAGGAFGGAGGAGGLSAAGSAGLGGVTYGATNSLELKMGSGGGGSVADTGRNGGNGGAGIKIVTGAGGWIGIRGIVNVSGKNGTNSVAGTADSAGGGGGSGGHIVLIGGTVNLAAGIISADGGGGGLGS